MKIIHVVYSGMGGHGDVIFPKKSKKIKKINTLFFLLVLKKFLLTILKYAKY